VTVDWMLICTGNERKACVSAPSGESMESNERHSKMDHLRVSDANTQRPVLIVLVLSCRCTKELESQANIQGRGTILSEDAHYSDGTRQAPHPSSNIVPRVRAVPIEPSSTKEDISPCEDESPTSCLSTSGVLCLLEDH
jgi:hypothetical protein